MSREAETSVLIKDTPVPLARKRFEEFDIGRALAMLFLPVIHVLEEMELIGSLSAGLYESYFPLLVIASCAAPLFMACMGANIVFSRHSDAGYLARRGVEMLVMGMMLNVARFGVPDALFGTLAGGNYTTGDWLYLEVFGCDIYDFAGLCFLTFALFKKLNVSVRGIVIAAVVALVAGSTVLPYFFASSEDVLLTRLTGRIFWTNENSCFPLLNFFIFPAVGYAFAVWYKALGTDEMRASKLKVVCVIGLVAQVLIAVAITLMGGDPLYIYASHANGYVTNIPNAIMITASLAWLFPLFFFAAMRLQGTKVLKGIVWFSSQIMAFYVAQWIFVGWMEVFFEDFGLSGVLTLNETAFWLVSLGITLLALLSAAAWKRVKVWRKSRRAQRSA